MSSDEEPEVYAPRKSGHTGSIMVLVSVAIVVVITLLLRANGGVFDLNVSAAFDLKHGSGPKLFESGSTVEQIADFIDEYGEYPSWAFAGTAILLLLLSMVPSMKPKLDPIRKYLVFIVASYVVGPLLINRLGKWLFSRPRPGPVYSGEFAFEVVFGNNPDSPIGLWSLSNGSFPSGHTSMAAGLFVLPFCLNRPGRKPLMVLSSVLTSAYVVLVGMCRMITGDHWLSDVVFGGYFVLLATWFLYSKVFFIADQELRDREAKVLAPYNRAYLCVLRARDLLEGKEPRWIKTKTIKVEDESAEPDESGKRPTIEKEVPAEEVPTDPKVCLEEAVTLYQEARLRAEDYPKEWARVIEGVENWLPRVKKFLELHEQFTSGRLSKEDYLKEWIYVV